MPSDKSNCVDCLEKFTNYGQTLLMHMFDGVLSIRPNTLGNFATTLRCSNQNAPKQRLVETT